MAKVEDKFALQQVEKQQLLKANQELRKLRAEVSDLRVALRFWEDRASNFEDQLSSSLAYNAANNRRRSRPS